MEAILMNSAKCSRILGKRETTFWYQNFFGKQLVVEENRSWRLFNKNTDRCKLVRGYISIESCPLLQREKSRFSVAL